MAYFFYIRRAGEEGPERPKYYKEENALRNYAYENDIDYDDFHVRKEGWEKRELMKKGLDVQTDNEKKEWEHLELDVQDGDIIVMKDLSCFPFEGNEVFEKYMEIYDRGVELVFLDNPSLCTEVIRGLLLKALDNGIIESESVKDAVRFNIYSTISNIEREHVERGNKIKGAVATSDKKSGRKEGKFDKLTPELENDIICYLETGQGHKVDIMIEHNISRNTLKAYMDYIMKHSEKFRFGDKQENKEGEDGDGK